MNRAPSPPSNFGDMMRCLRELCAWASEVDPAPSINTLLHRTTRGTSRSALGEGGEGTGETTSLQFKGQWDAEQSYVTGDIVIRKLDEEMDDGNEAGTYIAEADVEPGDVPPGVEVTTATADAVLTGTAVSGFTMTSIGAGYDPDGDPPEVTITGDGTGAEAHATVNPDGSITLVLDDGGEDYTNATVTIAPSGRSQKWAVFARGHEQKLTHRRKLSEQTIVIDAGRDGTDLPNILIRKANDTSVGSVLIKLSDIPVGAGEKELAIREWAVDECEGSPLYALFISTLAYTPSAFEE